MTASKPLFYLDLKHEGMVVQKFQPNPIFCSQQMTTVSPENVAEEKKSNKKSRQGHRVSQ